MLQRKDTAAAAIIIRIKYCHFTEVTAQTLNVLRQQLTTKGFQQVDVIADGFVESYENPEIQNRNRNTLITVGVTGDLLTIEFLVSNPE